jgi:predicted SAM-dependent methyltransferase
MKQNKNKVYCPIAKNEFKAFVKIGTELITPSNGARARQRLVWHYLENELKILSNEITLLHTAPELSFYEILIKAKNIKYIPGDKMVNGYSNQKGIQKIDLTNLEFEDSSFDCIVSNHVLEHIPEDRKAMSEMFRVLKVGGVAVITVPINESLSETYEDSTIVTPKDRKKHFGQWDHMRWYSTDIKERLEEAGFRVELIRYGELFSSEEFEKYGFRNDFIINAKKLSQH